MYYLLIIQNAGENSTQAVYQYSNIDDALSVYHNELGYRGQGRNNTACVIVDENGFTIYRDSWHKYVEPVEQES